MTLENATPYVILVISLIYQAYRESNTLKKSDLKETLKDLTEEIGRLKAQVNTLETKIGPFWQSLQNNLSEILHRPTHIELDCLLEKLQAGIITSSEREELRGMLLGASVDMSESADFRDQARLLLVVMPHAVKEAAQIAAKLKLLV